MGADKRMRERRLSAAQIEGLVYELAQHTLSALREVSQMADNKRNWRNSTQKLSGWVIGLITFVS